ncbi:MAG: ATP-binding protein [Saccharofermentanales bacterium]|jgi:DNA replication protein DnaC
MASLAQKINGEMVRIYERRRHRAHALRDRRVAMLYRTHPQLEALDRAVLDAGLARLEAVLDGNEAEATEALDRVERERADYLAAHGICDGYDEPVYQCRACGDTGRVGNDWCYCRRALVRSILPRYFPDAMAEDATFERYNLNLFARTPVSERSEVTVRDVMASHLRMAERYTANFRDLLDRNLFFSGQPGTGKTFLMQCIGHALMARGFSVIYVTAPNLMDMITRYRRQQTAYRPDPDLYEETAMMYDALLTWDALLIDDLGTEPATQDAYAGLLGIIDRRHNDGRATLIASNLSPNDLQRQYDRRMSSRLNGLFLMYRFPGDDVRLRSKHND